MAGLVEIPLAHKKYLNHYTKQQQRVCLMTAVFPTARQTQSNEKEYIHMKMPSLNVTVIAGLINDRSEGST